MKCLTKHHQVGLRNAPGQTASAWSRDTKDENSRDDVGQLVFPHDVVGPAEPALGRQRRPRHRRVGRVVTLQQVTDQLDDQCPVGGHVHVGDEEGAQDLPLHEDVRHVDRVQQAVTHAERVTLVTLDVHLRTNDGMQFNAMQCNATQRNATQRNATQRNATQRNATQRNATQRNATQRNATQRNATQRNATQRNATQRKSNQIKSNQIKSNQNTSLILKNLKNKY